MKITLQSLACDAFLGVIKLHVRVETDKLDVFDNVVFRPLEPKLTADDLNKWYSGHASDLYKAYTSEESTLPPEIIVEKPTSTTKPTATAVKPTATAVKPTATHVELVAAMETPDVEKPAASVEVIEAPKKKRAPKKNKEVVIEANQQAVSSDVSLPKDNVTTLVTENVVDSPVVDAVEIKQANMQNLAQPETTAETGKVELMHKIDVVEVIFDRTNRDMLIDIFRYFVDKGSDIKTNDALKAKIKIILDEANGKWVLTRDGAVNKGFLKSIYDAAYNTAEMPVPFIVRGNYVTR